ncbi:LPXTG cell wall anchor domain-containing protein [Staphylococcus sp. NRL 16/872]|uniref:LPXTG cell wall anchor domain-containing protein n=1 Tax=Staphylococcus sp. NRL 16/872 TaxID=2930131 RepID=UPI001FB29D3E|nr:MULTISPECIES: LPXTG cell wall anchor domain-containing protein [unclassified Staphylococcus]MCJ1661149.1 LPXTG cell wall anchor domain-containing protein [Staphylococcus sp. NRL 18/288]MCJ1667042.1 LPXTG cell wall anchor domain-containing protein [Staphylococcus sp. NRL 19/737]WEN69517.1 LPXTG cell wall anchor domain-containing protein [Staphylococcus sp. NRL 16/872]
MMKKVGILATSALAGTLLFAGTGFEGNQAHASEYSESSVTLATPQEWQKTHDSLLQARLKGGAGEGGGFGSVNSYQSSYAEYVNYLVKLKEEYPDTYPTPVIPAEGQAFLNGQNGSNSTSESNNQQTNANTTSNAQSSQDNSTTTSQNANHSTSQTTPTKALPETGETSNSGLVTTLATVLLAVGSFLVFRKKSTTK